MADATLGKDGSKLSTLIDLAMEFVHPYMELRRDPEPLKVPPLPCCPSSLHAPALHCMSVQLGDCFSYSRTELLEASGKLHVCVSACGVQVGASV